MPKRHSEAITHLENMKTSRSKSPKLPAPKITNLLTTKAQISLLKPVANLIEQQIKGMFSFLPLMTFIGVGNLQIF
jgi:hypothetical protein